MHKKEIKLPSGAVLVIQPAPFVDAKNLYQTMLKEIKTVSIQTELEVANLFKDIFCTGFSSPAIEACVKECLKRCTINNLKITDEVFEPVECREDFPVVYSEVAKENVAPFLKNLFADFKKFTGMINQFQA